MILYNNIVEISKNHWIGYMLKVAFLLASSLCFGAKIRKIGILLHTSVLLYKSGVQGGIHYTDMFS